MSNHNFYQRVGKRYLDLIVATLGLIVLFPLLLLVAVVIWWIDGWPIFYVQTRAGMNGWPIRVLKFRSMVHDADQKGPRLTSENDVRVTRLGRLLRRTKVDELPQLWNVLKGEMSLVGPRPEVPEYVRAYTEDQRKALEVKPGITGPASLACIDEETIFARQSPPEDFYVKTLLPSKLELDLGYCSRIRFLEDVKWIFLTFASLFKPHRQHKAEFHL